LESKIENVLLFLPQYGIPTMKLSKEVVQRRINLLADEGINFVTGVSVGKDISAQQLKDDNDVLLLSMGATRYAFM
jgi:NADPH-dependent glutamate synthase beta subunit-like oxidoreductase